MNITSTAFRDGEHIPAEHSKTAENLNPPLTFSEVPAEAKSLALIVEDPDVPKELGLPDDTFVHWLIQYLPPATLQILSGQSPLDARFVHNHAGTLDYSGPRPPYGTHRYFFKLYALDNILDLPADATRQAFYEAIKGHVIAQAQIVGLYSANEA